MNGIHDMGGMHGFGPVEPEAQEPVFHAEWEGRVYAMNAALGAWRKWNLDSWRHDIELLPPEQYLRSYYERWLLAMEKRIVRHGMVSSEELASGKPGAESAKLTPALTAERIQLNRRIPAAKDDSVRPRFSIGQQVRARNIQPTGHTRLPRYVRGKTGRIDRDHGVYVFPDTNAHGQGEQRQHVYSVRFTARELWGESASPIDSVYLDLWDDYLESA
jgi:nitrile hydratase